MYIDIILTYNNIILRTKVCYKINYFTAGTLLNDTIFLYNNTSPPY